MISLPLLKQSMKSNAVMWGSMTGVMSLLCVQFSMLDMTRSMLFTIFYGMMTTILPGIYVLVTANKLISSQVDRGSMAYILATPTKRTTVVVTQAEEQDLLLHLLESELMIVPHTNELLGLLILLCRDMNR